jgi:presenilin-like A22 family membrane protease
MKHKLSITIALLGMFLLAQIIGIFVLNYYNDDSGNLPFELENTNEPNVLSFITSLVLAFGLFFLLMRYNLKPIIKIWFLLVIVIALSVSLNTFIQVPMVYGGAALLLIALPLGLLKIFRPSIIIHNGTELLIYPGIAAIIAPLVSVWGMIILLILIAIYDAWAVWKSGIMQKMAKYQMEEVKIFGGFLIPHMDKKTREKIRKLKQKYKGKKIPDNVKGKKFKIRMAILGGGDIVFPILAMGVFMSAYPEAGLWGIPGLIPALFILGGAFLALTHLFIITKKDKAYPAMPWISTGILLGILAWKIIFSLI